MREFDPKFASIAELPFEDRLKAMSRLNDEESFLMLLYNLYVLGMPPSDAVIEHARDYARRNPRTEYKPVEEPVLKKAA